MSKRSRGRRIDKWSSAQRRHHRRQNDPTFWKYEGPQVPAVSAKMTLKELRAVAKDIGLKGYTKLKKAELIATIQATQA